ncbi:MAG: ArsR family transcriptional regulator [Thaumarchaeota archaeon]|nr:ArsR family transcriptional regulator [Nitrososphaerota archaeon]
MSEARSGEIYVLRNGKVVGIIRESDVVGLVARGLSPDNVKAKDVMHSPPPVVQEGAQLDELLEFYSKNPTSKVLVVDKEGKPAGTIAIGQFFQGLSCFTMGSPLPRVCGALASGPRLELINALASRPMRIPELAERLSLKEVTVRHHLRALMEVGLVKEEQSTRGKPGRPSAVYSITPSLFQRNQGTIKLATIATKSP